MLIKKISIPKDKLLYFFIGGMVYNDKFSFDTGSRNEYPFTTYYINRIMDKKEDDVRYKSLIYCKLPLICLQFESYCKCIEFDLTAECKGKKIFPFVGLNETEDSYEIIFKHFPETDMIEKKEAWLGFPKKIKLKMPAGKISFKVKEYTKKFWQEAVKDFFKNQKIQNQKIETKKLMIKVKEALFRSYDNETGTFIQMPWTNSTGFCMDKYSYSLLGFEAKGLNYFQELYERTGDPDYKDWVKSLEKLFLNSELQMETKNGFVWYNMTRFDGEKLKGLFYLDVGYAGYPPDQATISFNLGEYLQKKKNKQLEHLLKKNLNYILNTQNKDGSWLAALPYKTFKQRSWKKSEGSTAECARALLSGYKFFKDNRYKESAKRALKYLEKENIICRNVLRDIGIDEPEAFSAIIIIDAFLDAFEVFGEKKYIEFAQKYACHTLTWFYWYGELKGYFHPISESITPRISPFESLMLVETYKRMYKKTKEKIWDELANFLFMRVLEVKDKNNALSEGISPRFDGSLYFLPMEQTFATTELLHACLLYGSYKHIDLKNEKIDIEEKEDCFLVNKIIKINKKKFEMRIGKRELDFILSNPYGLKSRIYTRSSKFFRRFGLFNLIRDTKYVFTGVKPNQNKLKEKSISNYIKNYKVERRKNEILIQISLPFHKIEIRVFKSGKLKAEVLIFVKEHDLVCNKVIINNTDYTLKINWTNGGLFKKIIELE